MARAGEVDEDADKYHVDCPNNPEGARLRELPDENSK